MKIVIKKIMISLLMLLLLFSLTGCTSHKVKMLHESYIDELYEKNFVLDRELLDAYLEQYTEDELLEDLIRLSCIGTDAYRKSNYLISFFDIISQNTDIHFKKLADLRNTDGYYKNNPTSRTKEVSYNVAVNPGYSLETRKETKTDVFTVENYGDFCVEKGNQWKYLDVYKWISAKFYDIHHWVNYESIGVYYKGKRIYYIDNAPEKNWPHTYDVKPLIEEKDAVPYFDIGENLYVCNKESNKGYRIVYINDGVDNYDRYLVNRISGKN